MTTTMARNEMVYSCRQGLKLRWFSVCWVGVDRRGRGEYDTDKRDRTRSHQVFVHSVMRGVNEGEIVERDAQPAFRTAHTQTEAG